MRRWAYLFLALLYLLPQAGLTLHHDEAPVACEACPSGPAVECAGCEDDGHHHHDSHVHHPGGCRTCSAADFIAVEAGTLTLDSTSSAFAAAELAPSSSAALVYGRPIRAPPAA